MKSNKTSAGNTAVTPKMGAVIIVTVIHALIFCSVLQMQEVSANCVPSMMSPPPKACGNSDDTVQCTAHPYGAHS